MSEKRTRIDSQSQTTGSPRPHTPNFVLSDFDDIVAFYTKYDTFTHKSD
ncbi:unnamed protein product, partial [marine sediment metagenome]